MGKARASPTANIIVTIVTETETKKLNEKKLTFDDTKMVMAWLGLALWRCGVVLWRTSPESS